MEGAYSHNFNYHALSSVVKHLNEEGHFNRNETGIKAYSLILSSLLPHVLAGTFPKAAQLSVLTQLLREEEVMWHCPCGLH